MLAFAPTSPFSPFLVLFLLRLALASSLLPTRPPSPPPPHPPWQRRGHGRGNANHGTRVQRDDEHLLFQSSTRDRLDLDWQARKKVGLILVDVHDEDEVGPLVLPWLRNKRTIAPSLPIELWTSPSTHVPESIMKILRDSPAGSVHRVMPVHLPRRRQNGGKEEGEESGGASSSRRRRTRLDGFIGKAYALLHSHFSHVMLLDADSWMCPGWENSIFTRGNSSPSWNQGAGQEREESEDDVPGEFPVGYEYNAGNHTSAWDFRADVVWSLASFASQIYELTGFLVRVIPPLPFSLISLS